MAACDDERQQLADSDGVGTETETETDPYAAGFAAGFAAAANANTNGLQQAPDGSNDAWPLHESLLTPFVDVLPGSSIPPHPLRRPVSVPAQWSQDFSHVDSFGSLPRGFSSSRQLHEAQSDVLPLPANSAIENQLFDLNALTATTCPSPFDDFGWDRTSNEVRSSLTYQPSFILEGDVPLNCLIPPELDAALSEKFLLVSGGRDINGLSLSGSITNIEQPLDDFDIHTPSTVTPTIEGTLETNAPVSRKVKSNETASNASKLNVVRRLKQPKSNVGSLKPGATKQAKYTPFRVFRVHGRQRSRLDDESRSRTALTRAVGACPTCREKKLRCDQSSKDRFVPCGRCSKVSPNLLPGPCCRIEIIDIKLFRLGSNTTPATLQQWMLAQVSQEGALVLRDGLSVLEPPRRVYLTQDINLTTIGVTISRFRPGPDDTTAYMWTDAAGIKRQYELPPYYISDMAEAGRNMVSYAKTVRPDCIRKLLVNVNPIVRKTFAEAERYYTATKSTLVAAALLFWSATRMIERFWLICGADILGVSPLQDNLGFCRRNPQIRSIPVTPIMDTQLDEIAIKDVLIPLKAKLLSKLKTTVLAKKKEYWYEIYLTCFIILHNSERVNEHILDFSLRFGVNPEPKPRSNDESSLSQAYYHGCKTILAYFHFASGGAIPLALEWRNRAQDTPMMTSEQLTYLDDIKNEVARQDAELQTLKSESMYKNEMYWCHQMLFPDWKADMPHMGRLLEFTENDFLVS